MRKIDKRAENILSTHYKSWVDNLEQEGKKHPGSRTYYDDVIMNLLYCQENVCAYTEICISDGRFSIQENWVNGQFIAPASYRRDDHLGELEHFDPTLKTNKYWLWGNLFMIHSKLNANKSNKAVYSYLKPDRADYSPEQYFDYNDITHTFVPNTEIEDPVAVKEIWYMINEVLYLNHGTIVKARKEYINDREYRLKNNLDLKPIDQFFTATQWTLEGKPDV